MIIVVEPESTAELMPWITEFNLKSWYCHCILIDIASSRFMWLFSCLLNSFACDITQTEFSGVSGPIFSSIR